MRTPPDELPPAPVANVKVQALRHVLVEVCQFRNDSAILACSQRGDFVSVDELCDLTDGRVSDLVAVASESAAATGGDGGHDQEVGQGGSRRRLWVLRRLEVRKVQLLRLWRAHLYHETGAVPTNEDWLRLTAHDFEVFTVTEATIRPPTVEEAQARRLAEAWRARQLKVARDFLNSILNQQPVPIEGSGGMSVMANVLSIEAERSGRVTVFPRRLHEFWQACLDAVDAHDVDPSKRRCNVVAVGSSGVGKTACTPYLIKMLLERKKTVVYRVRHTAQDEPVYEFIPGPGDGADAVVANVYPADRVRMGDIPSLRDPDTYHIVDPSMYKGSCDMHCQFRPKLIIVAEPDERLWGSSQFFKARGGVYGKLKYFPLWELDELLHARPFLSPEMSDEQVKDRYEQVGGIPSHAFDPDDDLEYHLDRQRRALNLLTLDSEQFLRLAQPDTLPMFDDKRPANPLIGYDVDDDDDGTFSKCAVRVVAKRAVGRAFADAMRYYAWPSMPRAAARLPLLGIQVPRLGASDDDSEP